MKVHDLLTLIHITRVSAIDLIIYIVLYSDVFMPECYKDIVSYDEGEKTPRRSKREVR